MAHLHINGYQVVTQQGYEISYDEVLKRRGYSPNGNYQFARNGLGRVWRFRTIVLPQNEAQALASMLNMRGDHWRWDLSAAADGVEHITDDTTSSVYSDKRRIPQSAESECTVVSAYGADGSRVYDWNENAYAPFSGCKGALLVEPGTTNLLTASESDPESGALGWTNTSASSAVTASTSHYWRGAGSADVTWTAGNAGAISSTASVSTTTTYVFSIYAKGAAGGEVVRIGAKGGSSAETYTEYTLNSDTDRWQRLYHAHTTDGSDTTLECTVRGQDTSGTIYIDGGQLEEDVKDGYPTAWIDAGADPYGAGNGVRPAGVLDFDTFAAGYTQGFSVSAWVNVQYTSPSANRAVIDLGDNNPRSWLQFGTGNVFSASVAASDGSVLQADSSTIAAGWHHVVYVYDRKANTLYLYVDGALAGSDSTWSGARQFFDIQNISGDLSIGTFGAAGSNFAIGPLGPISVFPFAVPLSFVTKLYNSGTDDVPVPGLLPLSAHGDFLGAGEKDVQVYAQVNSVANFPYHDDTTGWESGAAVVDFTLYEATTR